MDTGNVVWIVTAGGVSFAVLLLLWRGRASHGEPDDHARHEHLEPFARRDDFARGGARPVRVPTRVEDESSAGHGRLRRR